MLFDVEKLARQGAGFGRFGAALPVVGQPAGWQPPEIFLRGLVVLAVTSAFILFL
jgi:hypothetical protein